MSINITPRSLAEKKQPVLLYNAAHDKDIFVSNDTTSIPGEVQVQCVAEARNRQQIEDTRNQFELCYLGDDHYRIYNPATNLFLWPFGVPLDSNLGEYVVQGKKELGTEFVFESCGDSQYRIRDCLLNSVLCVSETTLNGNNMVKSHSPQLETEERNRSTWFTLVFPGSVTVVDIEFNVDEGKISETMPELMTSESIENRSTTAQKTDICVTQTVSNTSHFTHEIGTSLTVGTEFKTGIPIVAEGKIKVDVSVAFSHTWGKSTTISKEIRKTSSMTGVPNTTTIGKCIVEKSTVSVPYRMTLETSEGMRFISSGTWQGISFGDMKFLVQEVPL